MTTSPHPRRRSRQWSLTLTEDGTSPTFTASLRWRTFPCRADHWDGVRTATVFSVGPPISGPEDLEAVLSLFVDVDWSLTEKALRSGPRKPV